MTALIDRIAQGTFEHWNGEGSWSKASFWRKADWRSMVVGVIEQYEQAKANPRPLRADAIDDNPEEG